MQLISGRKTWRAFGVAFLFFCSHAYAAGDGVQCKIDNVTFDGDSETSRIDYVVPPGDKPPRFRLMAVHADDTLGSISVELKTKGAISLGATTLDQEPLWKSVIKLPMQRDSAVTSGELVLTYFEPNGDHYASGTVHFQTADAHRGECKFRLLMNVVDLSGVAR